jgi:hypothetical protein
MALYFNNSKLSTGATYPVQTGQVSVSFWFTLIAYNGTGSNNMFGSENAFRILIDAATQKIYNELFKTTGGTPLTTLSLNTLYHYVATADRNTGDAYSYLNNVQESYDTGHTTAPTTPGILSLGGMATASLTRSANSIMEDFRVYNKILSLPEINNLYYGRGHDTVNDYFNRWRILTPGSGIVGSSISLYDEENKNTVSLSGVGTAEYRGCQITQQKRHRT